MTIIRIFSQNDQTQFAQLSGDSNPLHVDPLIARRTLFGRPVVHGVHLLLWALSVALPGRRTLTQLGVNFLSPVGVGEPVSCQIVRADFMSIEVVLESLGVKCVSIKAAFMELVETDPPVLRNLPEMHCKVTDPLALVGTAGALALAFDDERYERMFAPALQKIPSLQVAILLATTRLVGMECPGLNSIYSQLSLDFQGHEQEVTQRLEWRVESFDGRFGRVLIHIDAPNCAGLVTAFVRPEPVQQPSFAEVRNQVPVNCFVGQRSLVIGGSRGLGDVCAKLLAAGGADVRLTYRQGKVDAQAVASDICAGGGRASVLELDVAQPPDMNLALAGWFPTHVYYFPTAPIFVASKGKFSHDIFTAFCEIYVRGLLNTWRALREVSRERLEILYPSSVALDEIPNNMGEYAAAKAAGETLCRYLAVTDRKTNCRIVRFPRMKTDQTASIVDTDSVSVLDVLVQNLLPEGQSPAGAIT
jgi:NADP-dependent 3-hydroxy acid dehydrogenase YdfG